MVKTYNDSTSISYWTAESKITKGQTKFDIQIKDSIGYLLYMQIVTSERNRGYGRALYESIESFLREMGCRKVRLTPSGQGTRFWPVLGFKKPAQES